MSQSNDSGLNLDHLEACPFCGSAAHASYDRMGLATNGRVHCVAMDCRADVYSEKGIATAITMWNRRAALANQPAPTVPAATIFPDITVNAGDEVAWVICLPDGRVEIDSLFTDRGEALDYLENRAIDGCSLRALTFAHQPAPTVPAGDLNWHKEALAAYEGKLRAVWQGVRDAVEKYSSSPCEGEPFDRLDELLSRLAHQPAQEQAEPVAWMDPNAGCAMDAFLWQPHPGYSVPVYRATQQEPVAAPQQAESRKKAAVVGWEQRINAVAPALRVKTKEQAMEAEIAAWRELARQQAAAPEQFCDANCVWTDHHKDCTISAPGTPEAPKDDRKGIELWRATLRACGNLPEGYEVRIELENGCGMAVWYDAEGERHVIDGEGYLSDDVNEAVDAAIQRAAQLDGGQEGSGE
jgi:hypothetical protein